MYRYKAFGLHIQSRLKCPELLESTHAPDVLINYDELPDGLREYTSRGKHFWSKPGKFFLNVGNVAKYLVKDGRKIIIQRLNSHNEKATRLFLLGTSFGALLLQKDMLVLHGSAVRIENGSVIFLGESGIGKSTIAGVFWKRGYSVLTDDVCAIRINKKGYPLALPSYPQIKLDINSLEYLNINYKPLRKIRSSLDKRALEINEGYYENSLPIKKIYILKRKSNNGVEAKKLEGSTKFEQLFKNTYRRQLLEGLGKKEIHFQQLMKLADYVPVDLIRFSGTSLEYIDRLVDMVIRDIKS